VRSIFQFKVPCGTTKTPQSERRATQRNITLQWEELFRGSIYPLLQEGSWSGDDDMHDISVWNGVRVWYAGSDIDSFEVKIILSHDYVFAACSIVYVFSYLLFHTRSVLLSIFGPLIALASVPLTFVLCSAISGSSRASFANFLGLYLIVGFGADILFVYTDFWNESAGKRPDLAQRMAWTYSRAIRSSVTTTGTTALAFLGNLASVIRALRQFGFFMGMCVVIAWVLITTIYAPLMVVNHNLTTCAYCPCSRRSLSNTSDDSLDGRRREAPSCKMRLLSLWLQLIHKMRWVIVLGSVVVVGIFLGIAIPRAEISRDLPSVFPPGHNQNLGLQVRTLFDDPGNRFESSPREVNVCNRQWADDPRDARGDDCVFHWCEATGDMEQPLEWQGQGTCSCYREEGDATCDRSPTAVAKARLIGAQNLSRSQLTSVVNFLAEQNSEVTISGIRRSTMVSSARVLPPMLLQSWETGDVSFQEVLYMKGLANRPTQTSLCGWEDVCYCTAVQCVDWSGGRRKPLPPLTLSPQRRLAFVELAKRVGGGRGPGRPVAPTSLPAALPAMVPRRLAFNRNGIRLRAVFGLEVQDTFQMLGHMDESDVWSYNELFDMRQPWTQRNILSFCTDAPEELQVSFLWCWMRDFRMYVRGQTGRFPARSTEFQDLARRYISVSTSATRGTRYLWVLGNEVKATYVSYRLQLDQNADTSEVLALKGKWDRYVAEWNQKAFKNSRGAFHVSSTWVEAEASSMLIRSTLETLGILCILGTAAMIVFTRSCVLSFYVIVCSVVVLVGLVFCMIVVAQWSFGLIETIAIIYFIGYALDYSLHIAYKYSTSEAVLGAPPPQFGSENALIRMQRTIFAVKSIGGAVMGSAITTAGASFFLMFCNLMLFKRLGTMCLLVTVFSGLVAVCPLPALLMTMGPVNPGVSCCGLCGARQKKIVKKRSSKPASE